MGRRVHRPSRAVDRRRPARTHRSRSSPVIETAQAKEDREAVIDHIHGLLQAFIRKDREAIRRGHTTDWRGFQVKSRHIVCGIDEQIQAADLVWETMEEKWG